MKRLASLLVLLFLIASSTMGAQPYRFSAIGDVGHKGASGHDVRAYGAADDGSTDAEPEIATAITAAAGGIVIFSKAATSYKISSNVTIPAGTTAVFQEGGMLSIDSGVTFTVNGSIIAGLYQIFSGVGDVVLAKTSAQETVPQWWGALGDDSNDDTAAIQESFDAAPFVTFLPRGTYKISSALTLSGTHGKRIVGTGRMQSSEIKIYGGGNAIEITGTRHKIEDVRILADTDGSGSGIKISAGDGNIIDSCHIGSTTTGESFDRGVELADSANYTRVTNSYLRGNTSNIYMHDDGGTSPNACMFTNNVMLGGDYSINGVSGGSMLVVGNSFEGYATRGVLVSGAHPEIVANKFESSGVQPIELAAGVTGSVISANNIGTTSGKDFVLDNSGEVSNSYYPAKMVFANPGASGTIASNYGGSIEVTTASGLPTDVTMQVTKGKLVLESTLDDVEIDASAADKYVRVKSEMRTDDSLESPYGGYGEKAENTVTYSEEFDNAAWTKIGPPTITADDAEAPDGRTTADKILATGTGNNVLQKVNGGANVDPGEVITCRVWLKGDSARTTQLRISGPGGAGSLKIQSITLTTTWEVYEVSETTSAAANTYNFKIYPDQTSGTGYVHAWGAQAIVGSDNDPVPYVKTEDVIVQVDSPALVAADALVVGGDVISRTEMFIPATDFTPEGDGSSNATVEHDRADTTNRRLFERTTGISDTQDMDWYTEYAVSQTPASLTIWTRASDRANCVMTMTISDQAGNADATGGVVITPSADDTWEEFTYTFTSTYTNDEELWIKIAVTSLDTSDTADFGRAKIIY